MLDMEAYACHLPRGISECREEANHKANVGSCATGGQTVWHETRPPESSKAKTKASCLSSVAKRPWQEFCHVWGNLEAARVCGHHLQSGYHLTTGVQSEVVAEFFGLSGKGCLATQTLWRSGQDVCCHASLACCGLRNKLVLNN